MTHIPTLDIRDANAELRAVAANPRLRAAVWNSMRAAGFTDDQISFNEHAKGRHPSTCKEYEGGFQCTSESGKSNHGILDRYNAIEKTIFDSGLLEPLPEGAPFVGQVITNADALDALPAGTILRCVKAKANPDWPDVFLHTGSKRKPWLHLDPSDRDDGDDTEYSEAVLRWHGDGSAVILHVGTVK